MITSAPLSANVGVPAGAWCGTCWPSTPRAGAGASWSSAPPWSSAVGAIERAERDGSIEARLDAYGQLRQMIQWLRLPLEDPSIYPSSNETRIGGALKGRER